MAKKILAALLCAAMLLAFSGCSPAETISSWLDEASALIPNDIELIIAQLTGMETETEDHEIIYSEGYVNMLKSGTYNMVYTLSDGTEVFYGSNGVRTGSSYPEPAELEGVEPEYVGIPAYYDYNEKLNAYTRNGRVDLRYGDKVRVKCIAADREKREIDFALIRKI
jgi:hypothetical protein